MDAAPDATDWDALLRAAAARLRLVVARLRYLYLLERAERALDENARLRAVMSARVEARRVKTPGLN